MISPSLILALAIGGQVAAQNVKPQIAYVYPPAVRAGATTDVFIGGYDWTTDMDPIVHDMRAQVVITGEAGEPILTPPPYWFGQKAGLVQPPLAREWPAKITIPAGAIPGTVNWQVANANGGSNVGRIIVSDLREVVEPEKHGDLIDAGSAPLAVSGRISRITEVDRYTFSVSTAGMTRVQLDDRLGTPFRALLTIRDANNQIVVEEADTTGDGGDLVFEAKAGATYTLSLNEVDWAGDRSYVYRVAITQTPAVLTTLPVVAQLKGQRAVELIGWGLATGAAKLESFKTTVNVPERVQGATFTTTVDTPRGKLPVTIAVDDRANMVRDDSPASANKPQTVAMGATVTGVFDTMLEGQSFPQHRYSFSAKKGETLRFQAEVERFGSLVDPTLVVLDSMGVELIRFDDLPGTVDSSLDFKCTADGDFSLLVIDVSGSIPSRRNVYRLLVDDAVSTNDFVLSSLEKIDVPVDGQTDQVYKLTRLGAWKGVIKISWEGLPEGITAPEVEVAANQAQAKLSLTGAANAPTTAKLAKLIARAEIDGRAIEHTIEPILVTTTLKTRCKVKSAVQDGGRLVNRGTTYPAELFIERLEGYEGPVTVQMAATQQRQRRGMRSGTMVVPAGEDHVFYPIRMPEWLETSLTCRMICIGVTPVKDPRGRVRQVTGIMDGLVVMSIEGALLKLSHEPAERVVSPGQTIEIPVRVSRSARLQVPAKVELVTDDPINALPDGMVTAAPLVLSAKEVAGVFKVKLAAGSNLPPNVELRLRATAMQDGKYPATSETVVPLVIESASRADVNKP